MLETFMIKRKTSFNERRKVGFDTNVIIDIILYLETEKYIINLFRDTDLFYIHEISRDEAIEVLILKKDYSKIEAENQINNVIKKFNFKIIPRDKNDQFYRTIKIHKKDAIILSGWKKEGINLGYSQDNNFINACKSIGIDAIKIPTFDKVVERKLKDLFKLNKRR